MNIQPIEKAAYDSKGYVEVHSFFYTIQGEGPLVGMPAVFVRLAGCNLQCPGCDTDYTSKRVTYGPHGVVEMVKATNKAARLVVITGGEPFRQNITPMVNALRDAGFAVQVETNGAIFDPAFPYDEVPVIVSPKTAGIARMWEMNPHLPFAFKYVMAAGHVADDGLPTSALNHHVPAVVARPPEGFEGEVFLQPMDEKDKDRNEENQAACVESCLRYGYTFCLQLHKQLGIE